VIVNTISDDTGHASNVPGTQLTRRTGTGTFPGPGPGRFPTSPLAAERLGEAVGEGARELDALGIVGAFVGLRDPRPPRQVELARGVEGGDGALADAEAVHVDEDAVGDAGEVAGVVALAVVGEQGLGVEGAAEDFLERFVDEPGVLERADAWEAIQQALLDARHVEPVDEARDAPVTVTEGLDELWMFP
jgi:hypothetical protein